MGAFWSKEAPATPGPTTLTDGQKLRLLSNRTVVRVWTSKFHGGQYSGHVSIECLDSDNTPGSYDKDTYTSFWPYQTEPAPPGVQFNNDTLGKRWAYMCRYVDDRAMEERPPDYTFCFYTLDTSVIQSVFSVFKRNSENAWTLFGEYQPKKSSEEVTPSGQEVRTSKESCVSMACMCLDAGGINRLLGVTKELAVSSAQVNNASSQSTVEAFKHLSLRPTRDSSAFSVEELAFICGFCVSPDVMVGRLEAAKREEWRRNPEVRLMARTVLRRQVLGSEECEECEEWWLPAADASHPSF